MDPDDSPLALGQRLVELCERGRRVSTYKLATLLSIIDVCLENEPASDGSLAIPVQELAHRVVAYYWRQSRPYLAHGILSQNDQGGQTIPERVGTLRNGLAVKGIATAESAREAQDVDYLRTTRSVELILAQQPLAHLQNVSTHDGLASHDFLFDASRLRKKLTRAELDAHGPIVLRPGVPDALRRLASLLRPMIEMLWTADVYRMNRQHLTQDDLTGFLFGADRIALSSLAPHLRDLQNDRCFYCDSPAGANAHIDHVLPWSRVPIDGVANLVLADASCNLDKRASLPVPAHFKRAVGRPLHDLTDVARRARIPVLGPRTTAAGAGLYGSIPTGTALWLSRGTYEPSR